MRLNRDAYAKMIEEDIAWVNTLFPEYGDIYKHHIIQVLRESINLQYPRMADRIR